MIKIDEEIAAKQVRHCSLPWFGVNGERNDGRVVRLSTWDEGRGVRNLYLVADDAKTALMLVCHVLSLLCLQYIIRGGQAAFAPAAHRRISYHDCRAIGRQ